MIDAIGSEVYYNENNNKLDIYNEETKEYILLIDCYIMIHQWLNIEVKIFDENNFHRFIFMCYLLNS